MIAGYAYIVTDGEFCKIGKANDVAKRVSQLQGSKKSRPLCGYGKPVSS